MQICIIYDDVTFINMFKFSLYMLTPCRVRETDSDTTLQNEYIYYIFVQSKQRRGQINCSPILRI